MNNTVYADTAPLAASLPLVQARKPLVDLGSRMAHASMALAFLVSYASADSEYWRLVHVMSGYSLAGVLAFRLIWGWLGPTSARWGLLWRRVGTWRMWWPKLRQGQWQTRSFWVAGSSWLLSTGELLVFAFCAVAIASGWANYNELLGDGWLNDAVQELHEGLGNAAMAAVVFHLVLVVMLRIWRGPQAVRPMWRGNANTIGRR